MTEAEKSRAIDTIAWDKGWHIGDMAVGYFCPNQEDASGEAIRHAIHEQVHELGDESTEPYLEHPDFNKAAYTSLRVGLREEQRRSGGFLGRIVSGNLLHP